VPTEKQIHDRLVSEVADATGLPLDRVDSREPFACYGIGSLEAVYLVGKLESWLGLTLEVTLLWDHSTIDALARHLAIATAT
jgi:phthiocerol/phenolphthiocerol synthesis type-I polyketide synthase C